MSFLSPYMLWGAAAAGIPVALHFFFRSRYRTVPWAAMKFLLTSIEQTSRRLRFQELLLLLLRISLMILLALALARPLGSIGGGGGRGQSVDAVFLFDVSYSMGAKDGDVDRLRRAQNAAKQVLKQLPPHSTVQIIACADRLGPDAELGPREADNFDAAREIIDNLKLTSLATDLYPGVAKSHEILDRSKSANREFYLFSDMQRSGFEQNAGGLTQKLKDIHEFASVYMVRCSSPKVSVKNAAIVGITPQSGSPRPGERIGFAVLVKNTGTEALKDLEVVLMVDNDKDKVETQALPYIGPGEVRALTLTAKLTEPGPRIITAKLKHDDLDADNRFDQVIQVRDKINVLVVDGSPNEKDPEKAASFHVDHALYLRGYNSKVVPANLVSPALLQDQDMCILANVLLQKKVNYPNHHALPDDDSLDAQKFLPELEKFVRRGKGLLIIAGDNVVPKQYNDILFKKHGILPTEIEGFMEVLTDGKSTELNYLELNRNSFSLPVFWKFRDDKNYESFNFVFVNRALDMKEPPTGNDKDKADEKKKERAALKAKKDKKDTVLEEGESQVVLRFRAEPGDAKAAKDKNEKLLGDGKAAVMYRKVGDGQVFLFTTAPDTNRNQKPVVLVDPKGQKRESQVPRWNTWIDNKAAWVPFMDVTLAQLLQGQDQSHNLSAGQPLNWYTTDKDMKTYRLLHPNDEEERLGPPVKVEDGKGRAVVTAKNLPRAGIYYLRDSATPKAKAAKNEKTAARKAGIPIAVTPDLRESGDLSGLSEEDIKKPLGFTPTFVIAGSEFKEVPRDTREWTVWLLYVVLFVAIGESLLAWFCGRAW